MADGDHAPHRGHRRAAARLVHRPLLGQHRRSRREEGGFLYVSDTYDDDLPYWREHDGRQQLIIPYTLDANDMRFATPQGFNSGDQFFAYLKDSFDTLYAEGEAGAAKMMSIGLHCRLVGRPGRAAALARFSTTSKSHEKVWLPRRIDIARHWARHRTTPPAPSRPAMALERLRRTLRRRLRAFAVDRRARLRLELGPAHDTGRRRATSALGEEALERGGAAGAARPAGSAGRRHHLGAPASPSA